MLALALSPALAFNAAPAVISRPAVAQRAGLVTAQIQSDAGFDKGMANFAAEFPWLAKYGFGPTVKAERWNGRHAMFGWFMILGTAVFQKYGLFPNPDVPLKYSEWGALTQQGFGTFITNERAIIMIAHIHALAVSAAAAFGPQIMGDSLTLLDGEQDEEPYGLFPPLMGQGGLTPAAEMWNGRIAMLGIIALVLTSCVSGLDILDVIDVGTGGLLKAGSGVALSTAPVEAAAQAVTEAAAAVPPA